VPSSHTSHSSTASTRDTANSFGVHDALRYGTRSLVTELNETHPHQKRLNGWEETQDNLRLNVHRNVFGMHAPMRQLMERRIVSSTHHMPSIPKSNMHLDILMGRDETLDVSDFFGTLESAPLPHWTDDRAVMEKRHQI